MLKKRSISEIIFADLKRLEKFLKNKYGKILRYRECVNCGDSFRWKEPFKPNSFDFNNPLTKLLSSISVYSLSICNECVENHWILNPVMVFINLIKQGWNHETAKKIQSIIEKLKKFFETKYETDLELEEEKNYVLGKANEILKNYKKEEI